MSSRNLVQFWSSDASQSGGFKVASPGRGCLHVLGSEAFGQQIKTVFRSRSHAARGRRTKFLHPFSHRCASARVASLLHTQYTPVAFYLEYLHLSITEDNNGGGRDRGRTQQSASSQARSRRS